MEINLVTGNIAETQADAIIVNLFEGVTAPGGATGAVDQALNGSISQLIASGEIRGKLNEVTTIHSFGRIPATRAIVVGLGKQDDFTLERVRQVSGTALKAMRSIGAKKVATIVHGAGIAGLDPEASAQAVAEGSLLGLYRFLQHKKPDPDAREIDELQIVEMDADKLATLQSGVARGHIISEATALARDMVNEPGNVVTPTRMAEIAQEMAQESGLECEVFEREQMEELEMGALLGVARGSHEPPKFIILRYRSSDAPADKPILGLLGKAITFDTGGISIKPAENMGDMKTDMSGGAAVIGAMQAIGKLKPAINVTALIPATENTPGGGAFKPGDILKAMNGKTIEVISTDAEGRLILADALSYANKEGFSPLVDLATLTGACRIALGEVCTGAFGNNQEIIDQIIAAGNEAGERIWQMPMFDEYKEQNRSDFADVKNTGGRSAGAITAAQFLAEFSEDTPWVHLDIAGTARSIKEQPYVPKGGTGVGVRTLINLTLELAG